MRRTLTALSTTLLLLSSASAFAGDLDPEKAAQIQEDREKALAEVKKKYGNKKPSELSNAERSAMAKEQAEAEQKALQKNGVTAKEWSRYETTQSKSDRAATEKAREDLKKKEEAAQKAAANKGEKKSGEIEIQRGFGKNGEPVEESVK